MSASIHAIYETVKAALEKDDKQYLKDIEADLKKQIYDRMTYRSVLLMSCWVLWIAIASCINTATLYRRENNAPVIGDYGKKHWP
jgi:hypothetical protein